MKKIYIILLSVAFFSVACERQNNGVSKDEKETESSIVKKEINVMIDSVNGAWNEMIASDDQKFKDIKRLLDEISYTSNYNVVMHDSLVKKLNVIKSKRFDESLNLDTMDAYDSLTDNFIIEVFKLKEKTPGIEQHPLADELVNDINKANSAEKIVQSRKKYDDWAKIYNQYLNSNSKQLKELGEPYASLKEKAEIIK